MEPEAPLGSICKKCEGRVLENLWTKKHGTSLHRPQIIRLTTSHGPRTQIYQRVSTWFGGVWPTQHAQRLQLTKIWTYSSWSMKSVGDFTAFYKRLIALSARAIWAIQGHCNDTRKGVADRPGHATPTVTPLSLQHLPQSSARPVSITEQQPSSSKRALAARQDGNDDDLYPTLLTQKRLRPY